MRKEGFRCEAGQVGLHCNEVVIIGSLQQTGHLTSFFFEGQSSINNYVLITRDLKFKVTFGNE